MTSRISTLQIDVEDRSVAGPVTALQQLRDGKVAIGVLRRWSHHAGRDGRGSRRTSCCSAACLRERIVGSWLRRRRDFRLLVLDRTLGQAYGTNAFRGALHKVVRRIRTDTTRAFFLWNTPTPRSATHRASRETGQQTRQGSRDDPTKHQAIEPACPRRGRRARHAQRQKAAPLRALVQEMQGRAIEVVEATSAEDGTSVITSDSAIHAVLVDWTLGDDRADRAGARLLEFLRSRNDKIPIFLMAERGEAVGDPGRSDGDGRRVHLDAGGHGGLRRRPCGAAMRRYLEVMMPPLAAALDEVHPGVRVFLAHARPHGRHRVSQVAGRPDLLRLLRREPAALGSVDQRRRAWARCSITRAPWASTKGTRRVCSARTAPTASRTAPRCRTA